MSSNLFFGKKIKSLKLPFKKTKKTKKNNKGNKSNTLSITLKGWRNKVRNNNLIKIIKRANKKGIKKVIALDEIDYQVHATYDVKKLMKKINNNNNVYILDLYDKTLIESLFSR